MTIVALCCIDIYLDYKLECVVGGLGYPQGWRFKDMPILTREIWIQSIKKVFSYVTNVSWEGQVYYRIQCPPLLGVS